MQRRPRCDEIACSAHSVNSTDQCFLCGVGAHLHDDPVTRPSPDAPLRPASKPKISRGKSGLVMPRGSFHFMPQLGERLGSSTQSVSPLSSSISLP